MTLFKNRSRIFGLTLILLFVSVASEDSYGCAKFKEGYYQGDLEVFKKLPESTDSAGPIGFLGKTVAAVVIQREGWNGTIEIRDINTAQSILEPIRFSRIFAPSPGHLWMMKMTFPSLLTEFKLRPKNQCFQGHSNSNSGFPVYSAQICMQPDQNLTLKIRIQAETGKQTDAAVLTLSAAPFSNPELPENRPLTLKQAIQITRDTSPVSKAEFLQKRQARELLTTDWLRLLPRATLSTAVDFALAPPSGFTSVTSSIGTLAPFLSLNAWDAVDEARRNSQIVEIGFKIAQANLINQVEQTVYLYRRDVLLYQESQALLAQIQMAQNQVQKIQATQGPLEDLDQALKNAFNIVNDVIVSNPIANDRNALAQSLGIYDLSVVRNIKIGPELNPIEKAKPLNLYEEASLASEISMNYLERLQAQKVTEDMRAEKIKHIFKLLDFINSTLDGFGLNLIGELRLDQMQVESAELHEECVALAVRNAVISATILYNNSILGYQNALEARNRLKDRLAELLKSLEDFDPSVPNPTELTSLNVKGGLFEATIKDYLQFITETRSYHAAFRIARATLNRAKLMDYYEPLLPEVDRRHPDPTDPEPRLRPPEDDAVTDVSPMRQERKEGQSYFVSVPSPLKNLSPAAIENPSPWEARKNSEFVSRLDASARERPQPHSENFRGIEEAP